MARGRNDAMTGRTGPHNGRARGEENERTVAMGQRTMPLARRFELHEADRECGPGVT